MLKNTCFMVLYKENCETLYNMLNIFNFNYIVICRVPCCTSCTVMSGNSEYRLVERVERVRKRLTTTHGCFHV